MKRNMDEHSAGFGQIEPSEIELKLLEVLPDQTITTAAITFINEIEFAKPFDLRQAARELDDIGNDPATSAKLRPMYRALSDVVKSWR